jgi:hypothetical protein
VLCGVDGAPSAWLEARAAAAQSARLGERLRSIAVGADATCAMSRSALQIAPRPVMTEPATSGTGEAA